MKRVTLFLGLLGAFASYGADEISSGQLIMIGDHRLYVHCSGVPSRVTVVLVNGPGSRPRSMETRAIGC